MSEWKHDPGYGIPFEPNGPNQNIDPEYVKMVEGVSEDLKGKSPFEGLQEFMTGIHDKIISEMIITSDPMEPDRGKEIKVSEGIKLFDDPRAWVVKEPTFSVKPMLFVGTDENTAGGWHNFEGYFDTVEHAKKHVLKMSNFFDWAHIVVNGKIKVEGQNLKMSVNYPSNWKFTEVDDSEV
jgi:hypothetical protein